MAYMECLGTGIVEAVGLFNPSVGLLAVGACWLYLLTLVARGLCWPCVALLTAQAAV